MRIVFKPFVYIDEKDLADIEAQLKERGESVASFLRSANYNRHYLYSSCHDKTNANQIYWALMEKGIVLDTKYEVQSTHWINTGKK